MRPEFVVAFDDRGPTPYVVGDVHQRRGQNVRGELVALEPDGRLTHHGARGEFAGSHQHVVAHHGGHGQITSQIDIPVGRLDPIEVQGRLRVERDGAVGGDDPLEGLPKTAQDDDVSFMADPDACLLNLDLHAGRNDECLGIDFLFHDHTS